MVEGEKITKTAPKAAAATKDVAAPALKRAPARLYAKAVFTGYKRGLRNQHESQVILKVSPSRRGSPTAATANHEPILPVRFQIEGCKRKEDGRFYIGKRCVYVYKTKNRRCVPQHPGVKTRLQAVWGKVIRNHGNNGCVRAKFNKNMPGHAMGHRVRIVSVASSARTA